MLKYISRRVNQRRIVSIITLGLFVLGIPKAIATFTPRIRKRPSTYSRGGGSRGCPSDGKIPLTLLAPETYVGETASKSPTFAWYMSSAHSVKFELYEFQSDGEPKELGKTQELNASVGVNKIAITSTYPELAIGKKYLWQISLRCDNGITFERAEFEVVDMPLEVKDTISSTTQKINDLAQQGLWYDAFGEALKYSPPGKLGQLGSNLIQELVQSEQTGNTQKDTKAVQETINNLRLISKQ